MAENPEDPKELERDAPVDSSAAEADGGVQGGPLRIMLPPDMAVWTEARRMTTDKNVRLEDLAICVAQDPAIVLELIRVANAMYFSAGRPPITTTQTAIMRLGSDVVLENLKKIRQRPLLAEPEVSKWFELHRGRCRRTSIISKIIAEAVAKQLSDDCQTVGLFTFVGDMLAVAFLKERYVKLANTCSRATINYKLGQNFKLDTEALNATYLRRHGVPEVILFALDRNGRAKTPERSLMKPICMGAAEMVEAFDANRWEKLAPGKTIPPKSAIRMIPMSEAQYLKIYEKASEYLYTIKAFDEKKQAPEEPAESPAPIKLEIDSGAMSELDDEISSILSEQTPTPTQPVKTKPSVSPTPPASANDNVDLTKILDTSKLGEKKIARTTKLTPLKAPPTMISPGANKVMSSITGMFDAAQTSEDLLKSLLDMLVANGLFKKSAIIVISGDRKNAAVVASRGPNITKGQIITIDDPLNPLAACLSRVQSFGTNGNSAVSPFGSKAYAVAPINADHSTPVALYADCGEDGSVSFEARRVFRNVVDILNEKLPTIPGGIPVEV